MFTKPDPEQLLSIHQRLVAGDTIAPAEFAELVIPPLAEVLRITNKDLRDENMADEASTDAVLDFVKSPQVYVHGRSSIWSFLEMAAQRNLSNLLVKERRQQGRIARFKDVALHDPARKKDQESPLAFLAELETTGSCRERVNAEIASLSPVEAAVFRLMSDGIRRTDEYAQALGIADKPLKEQRQKVKQVKDRLMKRLKRSLRETDNE
jgi:DNA-binding CsgD family transcriptional regulator